MSRDNAVTPPASARNARHLLTGLLLTFSSIGQAEEDPFAAMDALMDAQFEQTDRSIDEQFERMDAAILAANERLSKEIGSRWGDEEIKLPSKVAWVDYSQDLETRRVVDFEAGVIEIEQLIEPDESPDEVISTMTRAAVALESDSMAALASKDTALTYAREELALEGITLPEEPVDDTTPVLLDIAEPVDSSELASKIREAITPAPSATAPIASTTKASTTKASTRTPETASPQNTTVADIKAGPGNQRIVSVKIPLKAGHRDTLASRYFDTIAKHAALRNQKPSLLLAIMETESSFNPRARSGVPAFGLMQLVPRSGAMDAYEAVYGKKELLEPDYLYNADNNVELGSAYLSVLHNRYLRHITNEESRALCVIAAYNTGAGNVARSFTGKTNVRTAATNYINSMTPDAVYEHLREKLPYEETRRYMQKVTRAQEKYRTYDTTLALGDSL